MPDPARPHDVSTRYASPARIAAIMAALLGLQGLAQGQVVGGDPRGPSLYWAQCATRRAANCLTMAGQKARRSSGERLVVNWPSTTTSVSTTSAPALRRSVHRLGH